MCCTEKQDCIALSTIEVEYVSCSVATKEATWLKSFLQDLNFTLRVDDPVEMCDNNVGIQFAKAPKFHQKNKHIKRHYHFVWDTIKTNEIAIKYISTTKR